MRLLQLFVAVLALTGTHNLAMAQTKLDSGVILPKKHDKAEKPKADKKAEGKKADKKAK